MPTTYIGRTNVECVFERSSSVRTKSDEGSDES